MHELSVAESIISSIEKLKIKENFTIIHEIDISIGIMAGIDIEALRFALEAIKDKSILKNAKINLNRETLKIKCNKCNSESIAQDYNFKCSNCDGQDIEIISGDSVEITALDVD